MCSQQTVIENKALKVQPSAVYVGDGAADGLESAASEPQVPYRRCDADRDCVAVLQKSWAALGSPRRLNVTAVEAPLRRRCSYRVRGVMCLSNRAPRREGV
jgi:hypothetical protein